MSGELEAELDKAAAAMSDEGPCGSCAHWQNPWDDDPVGKADDHIPKADRPRWGVCSLIDLPEYSETTTLIAFTQDGSDYRADFHTRDDFGCVLWAAGVITKETP